MNDDANGGGVEGRFLAWCGLLLAWLVVLGAYWWVLSWLGLGGWVHFMAMVPVLILLRMSIQRFLKKGRQGPAAPS